MTFIQARIAAAAALALSSSVAMADSFQFQKGFYIGANTGASFVTGQTYNELGAFDIEGGFEPGQAIFRDEASARGYNGGLTLGWDFYCDREYIYGLALSGNAYTNRAYQTINFQNFSVEQSWDLTYSADLTFKPGWFVSNSTELYAILGGSVAQVKSVLKSDIDTSDKKTLYGFVVGAGIQKQLCNRFSAFASYQYTYYGRAELSNALITGTAENGLFLGNRDLRLDTNVFKLGLLYTF